MQKYAIKLKDNELNTINNILESETVAQKAKVKAKVILLKSQGKDINTIMEQTKLSKRTIINYTNQYINTKFKGYFFHFIGNYKKSELNKFKEQIEEEFTERPPVTYKEATTRIKELTGLNRSETQVRHFLNKIKIYTWHTRAKIKYKSKRGLEFKTKKYLEELQNKS